MLCQCLIGFFLRLTYDEPEKDDSKQFISATHLHTDDVLVCYKRDVGLDNVAIYVVKDLRWQGGLDRASWDDGYEYLIELKYIKSEDLPADPKKLEALINTVKQEATAQLLNYKKSRKITCKLIQLVIICSSREVLLIEEVK